MYMESGEWLASSSASSSITSASATATGTSKSSLSSGATALTSTLTTCGHLLRAAGDPPFNLSAVSSAFPMVSHPVFGIHTTSSGRSEFGGLGTLGASAALATHAQLSPFPGVEWWRTTDVHARAGAPFFPPLLGIPQLFAPSPQNHDSSSFHSRTTNENGQSTQKGNNCMNGAVNGSSIISTSDVSASQATTTTSSSGQAKVIKSGGHGRICSQEQTKSQLLDTEAEKFKNKKPRKKTVDSSSNSESDSGSSSDSSSEGMSSSDSEDLEEDDEDEDQSVEESEDDDSDSESEAQHKNKTKVLMHSVKEVKNDEKKALEQKSQDKRTHQQIPLAADLQTRASFQPQQKQPQVLSQQLNFVFQSSQAKEESANKHPSVIQSTGLAPSVKPLSLVNQAKKETSPKLIVPSPEIVKAGNKNTSDEKGSPINDLRMKREQFKQTFPVQLKKQQEQYKNQKKVTGAVSSLKSTYVSPIHQKLLRVDGNHSNPFLANALLGHHQPNGVIQSVIQEAPLALTTKSRSQAKTNEKLIPNSTSTTFCSPVNLSTTVKNHSSNPMTVVKPSTSPALIQASGKDNLASNNLLIGVKTHLYTAPKSLDQCRGTDSDIPSSKDSDDSNEDDDEEDDEEDDDEEEDTDDSQSESDSNSETDSDGSEEDKGQDETETDTEGEKTPLKLYKTTPSKSNSSTGQLAHSAPLNLQLIKDSNSVPAALARSPASPVFLGTSAALSSPSTPSGSVKRRRITDERELRIPLEYGWQREIRIKNIGGRLQGEVAYYAPCGKKLRQYPEVIKYLNRNGITDITRDNFSFSAKIRVGDFYEARDGPQGMQWCLLKEEEIIPRIRSMEGRRGRPPNPDRQRVREELRMRRRKGRPPNVGTSEFPDSNNTKLLRKLQAQEIARQAAQIKLLRKLQKQEQARAAKEARKQQAIIAAEEKRKQKEQLKILKQQEKIKRIQQVRMEKELRAQQILEAKRKKKEEAANAKIVEAEKRIKEKEMRRQQAVLLKHQELERHRLDMVWERERRRQHMMLMKAMEARKKAEEKERLKQEKRDEKRLNKERKLEQRRLELEMAKELKKPNEDMCLADQKPLPELSRIPGLVLSGNTFSDCLMVVQFLRNFGKVLGFDVNIDVPSMSVLQEGLLNVGDSMGEVQDLLVRLLSAAVCDPGVPSGHKVKTALGDNLMNVGINRDNVSEILQIYMEAHCGQTELTESLTTKAFQAHTPAQKASVLAFLVNELACSKSIVSEIDKNIDYMSNLRRDKWMVEGKLRKLRIIHAKKTGKKDSTMGADGSEEQHSLGTPTPGRKRKRKGGDSDDDDDEDDDSDDQADEDDEDEEEKEEKKGKKETCEDEDDGDQTASIEELEKQIEKLIKQQSQYRRKLFEASHSLRSMMFGQDRYKRRYWVLPQCGGVFVEGMESGEVTIIDVNETEEKLLTRKAVENWSVEQKAMEIDLAILQQVEDLERRVASASLQVKGWTYPELDSERDDLVYCEHKLLNKVCTAAEGEHGVEDDARDSSIERQSNNPLDLAVTRLAELERNIERRYLKSPLSTTIQIKLDNVGTVTVPAPAPSISGDGDGAEENIAPGLKVWRKALLDARSAAQVALCIQQLQKSIAWEKSIMKVYCQICRKGDNEELLLLCDGCDKGCHTYCHRPKITTIPEGDWFCPACIAKASGQSPKSKKHNKGKKCNDQKRGRKTSLSGEAEEEDAASTSSTPKKGGKEPKKRKLDEIISVNLSKQEIILPTKKPKATRDDSKDLAMCSMILSEMETHEDAWPFLLPVNLKLVPGYKKVIKKPMDFFTIREKLSNGQLPDHLTPPKKKKVCYEDLLKEEPLVCLSYGCGSNSFLFGIPCKFIGNSFWVSFVDSSSITTLL
ncbi:bromodomain adjacent to zinc finger domain protein 2B isoform X20 [Latimeria chalumnae]|uniref:bromodomain adjacent to zinc finger domain protein 2B isoform X20 n=1 Tax=Latimeria chalumnae TaxID=7897 RepID=UPI00313BA37E